LAELRTLVPALGLTAEEQAHYADDDACVVMCGVGGGAGGYSLRRAWMTLGCCAFCGRATMTCVRYAASLSVLGSPSRAVADVYTYVCLCV
jgi:hypothetical protein